MSIFVRVFIIFLVVSSPLFCEPNANIENEGLSLASLIEISLKNNAVIRASEKRVEETKGLLLQAGLRPNPQLEVGGGSSSILGDPGNSEWSVGLVHTFELGHKRQKRVAIANIELIVARQQLQEQKRQLVLEVKKNFADFLAGAQLLAETDRAVQLHRRLHEITVARVEEGEAAAFEEGLSQLELNRIELERASLITDVETAASRLRTIAGVGEETSFQGNLGEEVAIENGDRSLGRNEATARGCFFVTQEAAKVKGFPLAGATAAIQGFGNAGAILARLYHEAGVKVIAVSDSLGGLHNPKGLNIPAVLEHKEKTGQVLNCADCDSITNEDLLELKCDVLAPSALENVITLANADRIRARIVAEAANGPTTPGADKILFDKDIFVLPDILANAGGVTVSYFEWVQDLQGFFWDEDNVNRQLQRIMTNSFHDVYTTSQKHRVDMRIAAYILAIDRVVSATKVRGLFP